MSALTRSSLAALFLSLAACSSAADSAPPSGDVGDRDGASSSDATAASTTDDAGESSVDAASLAMDSGTLPSPDASETADANADANAGASNTLDIPATDVTVSVAFDVTLTANASGTSVTYDDTSTHESDVGSISIRHGVGTFTFRGAPAQAFASTQTTELGATSDPSLGTDYQLLARQDGRLIILYLRCFGTSLEQMYYESTDGYSTHDEVALTTRGTCASTSATTNEAVSFAATALPPPTIHGGATITGAGISFDGTSPGAVTIMSKEWALYPFQTVDCTECATPGWYELHSILWNAAASEACFTVGYLEEDDTDHVLFGYVRCLPTGDQLGTGSDGAEVPATWTVDTSKFDGKRPSSVLPTRVAR